MTAKCAIWDTGAQAVPSTGDYSAFNSPRAGGAYRISRSLLADNSWTNRTDKDKAKLTTWLVEQRAAGDINPLITAGVFEQIKKRPGLSVPARRDGALRALAVKSPTIGHCVRFYGAMDAEYVDNINALEIHTESINRDEAISFATFLVADRLCDAPPNGFIVSFAGWNHLEDINRQASASEQVFVAMWFNESVADAYSHGIEPAIRDAGYRPLRIDKKEHINKIDDEIVAEIRRSRFLVADFTSDPGCPRGGVYFEAGFAFGLNKPVIWTCRSDLIGEVHFDTRQYNHIVWTTPEELHIALYNRITAVLGDGPLKKAV